MIGIALLPADSPADPRSLRALLDNAAEAGLRDVIVVAPGDAVGFVAAAVPSPAMLGLRSLAIVPGPVTGGVIEGLMSAAPFAADGLCCVIVGPVAAGSVGETVAAFYGADGGRAGMCTLAEPEPHARKDAQGHILVGGRVIFDLLADLRPLRPGRLALWDLTAALEVRGALHRLTSGWRAARVPAETAPAVRLAA